jgi:two-component system phosphate regulon sensor histidine kinase PhoR
MRVTLIEPDGRVVADSEIATERIGSLQRHGDRPEVIAALAGEIGRDTRASATLRRRMRYLALPPASAAGDLVVRVAVDLEDVAAETAELRRELLLAGALGLVGALVLSYAITRRILRPVETLRRAVIDIADGKLDQRLHLDAPDELGEIAVSVNRVAEQLRSRFGEVAAEKTRLEAVLRSMVEGVLVLDPRGRVTLANPRLQELLDVWSDPLGKSPLDLIRSEAVHHALAAASKEAEPQVVELSVGPRTLLMHAIAVPPVGEGGCVAVFHDVTELRRLDQVRRDFLANASHELRTPLTSIKGFAATLLQEDLPAADRKNFIEVVARNAERLGNLIDDILELSQIEGRREPLRATEVDVEQCARVLIDDLRPRLKQRELTAEVHADGPPCAWADRRAVEQVLTNLLDNAVKYSEKGGRIDVRIRESRGRLEVVVADEGVGIPENEIDRVFERFYRVDKARSRALGGTGLGLSIVKHLVQAMGGEIRLESKLGVGSSFTFWLPIPPGR